MEKTPVLCASLLLLLAGCAVPVQHSEPFAITYLVSGGFTLNPPTYSITVDENGTITRLYSRGNYSSVRQLNLTQSEFAQFKGSLPDPSSLNSTYACIPNCNPDLPSTSFIITMNGSRKEVAITHGGPPPSLSQLVGQFQAYDRRIGAEEGEFCGGIAAFQCASGLQCNLSGSYPDAGGECVPS